MPRYSANKDDPGYNNFVQALHIGVCVQVFLDDKEVRSVVTADEDAGLLVVHLLDEYGQPCTRGGELLLVELHGKVKVHLQPPVGAIH